jgi:transposase-like protein
MGGSPVGARYFEHKARRAWWATHLEAWRRSGVSRTEYCRLHRLTKSTFDRWLGALNSLESAREEARKRRKRTREPVSGDKRNKAVQAFWAMHVEALNWSGVSAKDYAAAHHISVYSLRTWRARMDAAPLQVDWRARLHPSVRPTVSTSASDSAKEPSLEHIVSSGRSSAAKETALENSLTDDTGVALARGGRSNRRSFTEAEKLAIVMEAEQPGVSAAAVCRRHNIATSMIFRWRVQFGVGRGKAGNLAAVQIADEQHRGRHGAGAEVVVLQEMLPVPPGAIAVELADGRRVFAPAGSDPEAVRRYVTERENARC